MLKFLRSVNHGIAGLVYVTVTESNMRWHVVAMISVTIAGFALHIAAIEWAIIVGCIGIMLALECMNTSIERLADRVTNLSDPLIGQAKDAAAGAVLAMAVASAIIGAIVFVPRLFAVFE